MNKILVSITTEIAVTQYASHNLIELLLIYHEYYLPVGVIMQFNNFSTKK